MHPVLTEQFAKQHIVELHQQAAAQRLIHKLPTRPGRATRRRRAVRDRLRFWRPRQATA